MLRLRQFIQMYLWMTNESPAKRALACAIGLGISVSPFWGFHTFLAVFLAWVLKLNKVLTIGFSAITIPPVVPFIVAAQVGLGRLILEGKDAVKNMIVHEISHSSILNTGVHLLFGGVLLAVLVGGISYYMLLYILLKKSYNTGQNND